MNQNKILATVNGREITQQDVENLLQNMGQQRAAQFRSEEGMKRLLQELVNQELFYLDAVRSGLDQEPAFQMELRQVKENLLKQYAIQKYLSNVKVTEEEMKKFYDENQSQFQNGESVKASHILVDDEDKAREIYDEIQGGLSFEDAAKKYSSCPSSANGGDLGYFTRGKMVPEFEEAAFDLKKGEISVPVETQFGYHLIKLADRKDPEVMAFDQVKNHIAQQLTAEKQSDLYTTRGNQLRLLYEVKYM